MFLTEKHILKSGFKLHRHTCGLCSKSQAPEAFSRDVAKQIEAKWRTQASSVQDLPERRGKKYVVPMFPYPSGHLHMGHVRVYTISDCLARYGRLKGYSVCQPMGWDAFGLPAENAALQRGLSPNSWTSDNIEVMREQLSKLGCAFNWEREFATCDPSYYKWTQHLFLRLHKAGYTRRQRSLVNWDPVDNTVLADEQIDEHGRSWRSGAVVEKKILRQWFIRLPLLAKELWDELRLFSGWKEVVELQRYWIGDCDVFKFSLQLKASGQILEESLDIGLSDPIQFLVAKCIYVTTSHVIAKLPESGTDSLSKIVAIHPLTGEELPIIISDDVEYDRDLESKLGTDSSKIPNIATNLNATEIVQKALKEGWGGYMASRRLRDWVVSRQRYWGTPIPIVHCGHCGAVPVPDEDLPVVLPVLDEIGSSEDGTGPLSLVSEWKNTPCPKCGQPATRETDTLDTFFDSSWYFLRYLDPHNTKEPFSMELVNEWMPVDIYVGGKEHALMHLLFARFVTRFLWKEGVVKCAEPFKYLLAQGVVKGKTYISNSTGAYVPATHVQTKGNTVVEITSGEVVSVLWEKMSKSKFNGVDPSVLLDSLGTDLTRLLIIADVAPQQDRNWNMDALKGVENWMKRLWWVVNSFVEERGNFHQGKPVDKEWEIRLRENYNFFLRHVSNHMENTHLLNTAITRLIGLTNTLRKVPRPLMASSEEMEKCVHSVVVMLSVFAPHIAAEMWAQLGSVASDHSYYSKQIYDQGVWNQQWPALDTDAELDLVYFVNDEWVGRIRMTRKELKKLETESALRLGLKDLHPLRKVLTGESQQILDSSFDKIMIYNPTLSLQLESVLPLAAEEL